MNKQRVFGKKGSVGTSLESSRLDREALDYAARILQPGEFMFLNSNWRRISYRLEKAAREFDQRDDRAPEGEMDLLLRLRPLLDGIAFCGSSPENYRSALTWLDGKLPKDADRGLALAASLLCHVGTAKISRSRSPKKRRVWKLILSQVDLLLASLEAASPQRPS